MSACAEPAARRSRRWKACSYRPLSPRSLREGVPPEVLGAGPELLLDSQKLVVLRDAARARGRTGFDLAGPERARGVGDRRVPRLAGGGGHPPRLSVPLRESHRLDRL